MSASPVHNSAKRPLEDPSSPSGPSGQPDAKRPALDKTVKTDDAEEKSAVTDGVAELAVSNGETERNGVKDDQGDTVVTDAQPIETTTSSRGSNESSASNIPRDESKWIHIRAVISSAEAATIIGKGGENVSVIRKMSGSKCTVSDYQRGAVERILTVSGSVDGVAKVSSFSIDHRDPVSLVDVNLSSRLLVSLFELLTRSLSTLPLAPTPRPTLSGFWFHTSLLALSLARAVRASRRYKKLLELALMLLTAAFHFPLSAPSSFSVSLTLYTSLHIMLAVR